MTMLHDALSIVYPAATKIADGRKNLEILAAFLVLALLPGLARADAMRLELIGGSIATRPDGDVVLDLEIAPLRLDWLTRAHAPPPTTWGDVRRREPLLQERLLNGLALQDSDRYLPPDDVEIPDLAAHADRDPLPAFIPIEVTWRHAGLLHAAFSANDIVPRFPNDGLTQIQLVLQDQMPWWQVLTRSMLLGIEHIVPFGLDHILFVLGIYLAASRFRDLLWQVTAFTVAHSLTLGLTMGGILIVGPFWEQFVEIGIAISIFTVAFENCLWRRPPGWPRIFIVGGFGLVHGMGFAGRLSQVKWPPGTFGLSLFGANVGIEIGQLIVILAAASLTAWWWKKPWYLARVAVPISLLIGLYGMFAALDRITLLQFPRREFADAFWNVYDHDFWLFPLGIGTVTLAIVWIVYRFAARLRSFFLPGVSGPQPELAHPLTYRPARDRGER
jgi:hydrogenase/urease accessory protein HupE